MMVKQLKEPPWEGSLVLVGKFQIFLNNYSSVTPFRTDVLNKKSISSEHKPNFSHKFLSRETAIVQNRQV